MRLRKGEMLRIKSKFFRMIYTKCVEYVKSLMRIVVGFIVVSAFLLPFCVAAFVYLWVQYGSFNDAVTTVVFVLGIPHKVPLFQEFPHNAGNPVVDEDFEINLRCLYSFFLTVRPVPSGTEEAPKGIAETELDALSPTGPKTFDFPVRLELYEYSDDGARILYKAFDELPRRPPRAIGGLYSIASDWLDPGKYSVKLYFPEKASISNNMTAKFGVGYSGLKAPECDYLSFFTF